MFREILDLLGRRRGSYYDRPRGGGGLLGRILGGSYGRGSYGRGRYDERRRFSHDDDDEGERWRGRRRRRYDDDDDD